MKTAPILLTVLLIALVSRADASPLFEDDTVLSISLSGPINTLVKDKKDREEHPFILRADGVEHKIQIRVRGKSRPRVCDFPPLRLNFAKKKTKGTVFAGQNKLKLVTHCRDNASAQTNVLKEYLAYKIFGLLSDVSYKVRLVQITYQDTDQTEDADPFVSYGYLIESKAELADRVGGHPVKVTGVTLGSLDDTQAASVYVFEYLIGNTDWSLVTNDEDEFCCHNVDLVDIESERFIVPYDFDLSGLVNTWYARPDPSLSIRRVTQRWYRGACISPEALEDAIRAISEKETDILGIYRQVPGLTEKKVKETVKFLGKYFDEARNPDKLLKSFERRCL